jgi:hypothetical protein
MKFSRNLILGTFMLTGAAQALAGEPIPGVDVELGKEGGGIVRDANSAMGQVSTTRGRVGKPPAGPAGISDQGATGGLISYTTAPPPADVNGDGVAKQKQSILWGNYSDRTVAGPRTEDKAAPGPLPASAQVGGFGNGAGAGPSMGAGPIAPPSPITIPNPGPGAGSAISPGMNPGGAMGGGAAMRGR